MGELSDSSTKFLIMFLLAQELTVSFSEIEFVILQSNNNLTKRKTPSKASKPYQ
ncbi:MAG: hypothetical protein Q7W45_05505 [Bacteroidota bacterium]|nr:hypothetical protein [Bacteroidota bacterium]